MHPRLDADSRCSGFALEILEVLACVMCVIARYLAGLGLEAAAEGVFLISLRRVLLLATFAEEPKFSCAVVGLDLIEGLCSLIY